MLTTGERVVAIGRIDGKDLNGKYGTVIYVSGGGSYRIGVQFDDNIGGHNCHNHGEDGYCWYCDENQLQYIEDELDNSEEPAELLEFLRLFAHA